ncbi:MAG TPA: hypothetical protein VI759_09340 [Dehalococcoidia bacterium]|nr:hypothetical protein [Dehalococcoidia bacterium]
MAREKVRETESAVQEPDIWQVLLRDVEAKLDSLSQELTGLKTAVGRLSAMPSPSAAPVYEETPADEIAAASPEPGDDTAELASELAAFEPEKSWTETEMPAFTGLGSARVEAEAAPASDDDEASREEVRRAVEALRDEIGSSGVDEAETAEPAEEDESSRDEVRRAVEAMRAEMTDDTTTEDGFAPAPEEDEDPSRDEVRRAVEAMRAEMAGEAGHVEEPDAPVGEPGHRGPTLTEMFAAHDEPAPISMLPLAEGADEQEGSAAERWQARHDESTITPLAIVIEDSQGRVELSRVYDALSRVDCAAQAALLNYTPHSVTVGLSPRSTLPQPDALVEAVAGVFGVPCRVSSDGLRLTVQLGEDAAKGAA